MAEIREIRPQPKQEQFLSTPSDIAIYGGSAGGGKSFSLLLEPLRHVTTNPEFYAVVFRRTTTQIRNPGGLWDESAKLYPLAGGQPVQTILEWKWPKGGRVKMAHLEHEKTVYDWQGSQIPMLGFDEITHFTESQFFYMLSRNRSMCGVQPYVRATCNPDADSWVANFISWWIDHNGYAIPERSGQLRWFVRVNGEIKWADTKEECIKLHGFANLEPNDPAQVKPKSVTFISARLEDNKALMEADPGYMSNLLALDIVSQARLLGGNWKIRWDTGMEIFKESSLLDEQGQAYDFPTNGDYVYCTIDTAMKDGAANDGTAAVYWLRSRYTGKPLMILDWEFFQMEGSLLEFWLPSVF
ncbi:MAG TPA: terminase family protein, partial [Methanosarcina sp.]|nr:terminase family protein [Methanosarcina sp.]